MDGATMRIRSYLIIVKDPATEALMTSRTTLNRVKCFEASTIIQPIAGTSVKKRMSGFRPTISTRNAFTEKKNI